MALRLFFRLRRRWRAFKMHRLHWVILVIFCVYIFFFRNTGPTTDMVRLRFVVVHFDLKGAPPKLSYLKSLLPMLKRHGVNAIMMEYEDMFPYEDRLEDIRAQNCYRKKDLQKFLKAAFASGIDIIPLIQTFGHMEFVLKLEEYRHLRESRAHPDTICPSRNASIDLIDEMLKQVITFHKKIAALKYIHIGCDEVYSINICASCLRRKTTKEGVFLRHVKVVSDIVLKHSPATKVLIWDDMIRKHIDWKRMEKINVIPVYWDYTANIHNSHFALYQYQKQFEHIWIASAFKGADGKTNSLPNLALRFQNHVSWMNLINRYIFAGNKDRYIFQGIILTGWSRYSHMEPLTELLPVSIPSLILSLHVIQYFKREAFSKSLTANWTNFYKQKFAETFSNELKCMKEVDLERFENLKCNFQGEQLYNVTSKCLQYIHECNGVFEDQKASLFQMFYYLQGGYHNRNKQVDLQNWCYRALETLFKLETDLENAMSIYYNKETILEYINLKLKYTKIKLVSLVLLLKKNMAQEHWERGPIINALEAKYAPKMEDNLDYKRFTLE